MTKKTIVMLILVALLISSPFWLFTTSYSQGILIKVFIFASLALAWNIIGGFGGQLAFGNAAFFGLGAYSTAIGFANYAINPWVGMLLGAILAAMVSIVIGYPSFRLRGIYFSLCTFVFSLILELLARHFINFTGGDIGISVPLLGHAPGKFQFDSAIPYYFIGFLMMTTFVYICWKVKNSKFGFYLSALRNDQEAAEALGIHSPRIKMYAFMLSACMSAVAGAFYVQYTLFIDPATAFGMNLSIEILLLAIAGGIGFLWGPVLGAFALIPLGEITNQYLGATIPGIDLIVYAIVLIIIVKVLPEGLAGLINKLSTLKTRGNLNAKADAASKTNGN